MDFNQSFYSYDTMEGANCQTVYPRKMTQREAAVEAVRQIGLEDEDGWRDMFYKRLDVLRQIV